MSLLRDMARCKGREYGTWVKCPERDRCARFATYLVEVGTPMAEGTISIGFHRDEPVCRWYIPRGEE